MNEVVVCCVEIQCNRFAMMIAKRRRRGRRGRFVDVVY